MRNERLLEIEKTEPLIKEVKVSELDDPCNLVVGIGLANSRISFGLPIDSLAMVFVSELLKRELRLGRNYLLIADTCACQNGLQRDEVNQLAEREKKIFGNIADRLGFSDWDIFRASEIEEGDTEFASILEEAREARISDEYAAFHHKVKGCVPNDYVAQQLSEMRLLRRRFDTKIKVGWRMPGSSLDERQFDSLYTEMFGADMAFVYVECGKTLNPKKPNAPPYLLSDPTHRIVLGRGEDVKTKLKAADDSRVRDYRSLLGRISGLYKKLMCGFSPDDVAQNIIDKVCYDVI